MKATMRRTRQKDRPPHMDCLVEKKTGAVCPAPNKERFASNGVSESLAAAQRGFAPFRKPACEQLTSPDEKTSRRTGGVPWHSYEAGLL
ncbi:hypothetical protein ATANTOWER_001248 [Ataeniobius toweri]|uniref:Uncharacterized protein n=1 Tax=Ataeniobius toweri TaxID=208326 RepID=A0ABU7C550_9TELE|nr:hypothetical protein [Ataeniobius toweri]